MDLPIHSCVCLPFLSLMRLVVCVLACKPEEQPSLQSSASLGSDAAGSGLQSPMARTLSEAEVAAEKKSCEQHAAPESFTTLVKACAESPRPQP